MEKRINSKKMDKMTDIILHFVHFLWAEKVRVSKKRKKIPKIFLGCLKKC